MTADVELALNGDQAAIARLITAIERTGGLPPEQMNAIFRRTGRAEVIGVTGPPGAGKSTLTAAMVSALREAEKRVAVLAVDPSSPLTGGAVLGDRVRMAALTTDPGVFVRSMASRGVLGGLALAAPAAIRLLDAVGMDVVVVETVGVGQSEIAVATVADCVLLVLSPGGGDGVQAMKAGVLEVADLIVVNKADLPGAVRAGAELRAAMRAQAPGRQRLDVLLTEGHTGEGVPKLMAKLKQLLDASRASGALEERRLDHLRREALERATWAARRHMLDTAEHWLDEGMVAGLSERTLDPVSVGDQIAERALGATVRAPG